MAHEGSTGSPSQGRFRDELIAAIAADCGVPQGVARDVFLAIGEHIAARVAEGHAVLVPGLGNLQPRFWPNGKGGWRGGLYCYPVSALKALIDERAARLAAERQARLKLKGPRVKGTQGQGMKGDLSREAKNRKA
ncbi:MAG: hypothetical protein U1B94_01420 [candidate division NC10 bacterium]|nr:hypothetical protein [candidate division NC10 bacterium]